MPDLSVSFCGTELKNPLVASAAGITETADRIKRCEDAGCGGAVIKSYFEYEPARHSPSPRFKILEHQTGRWRTFSLYSFEQANVYGLGEFARQIEQASQECDIGVFASLNCNTEQRWEEAAGVCEQAGADAIELNVSCPHGTHIMAGVSMLDAMKDALHAARRGAGDTPLLPKVTGQLDSPQFVVNGIAEAGADGVVMFNRFTGLEIDVENEEPIMHGGYAGHGGPYSIHYVLRWISQVSPGLDIPIAASGGVTSGADVAKHILAGATIAQVCSAIVMNGYEVAGDILDEFTDWMERQGHETPAEFRGAVCPKIKSNEEVERAQDCVAEIDAEKCTDCGVCSRICIYDAAQPGDAVHHIDQQECVGCGLCAELCPFDAIQMVDLAEPRTFELGVK